MRKKNKTLSSHKLKSQAKKTQSEHFGGIFGTFLQFCQLGRVGQFVDWPQREVLKRSKCQRL